MMKDFSLLPQDLQDALKLQNITTPTPVQAQAIEPALQGRDVLGTAQTGTGKTYAFLLPILARMETYPESGDALVLAPTRELAQQIYDALNLLKKGDKNFRSALVIGGDNIQKQFAELRKKPRFIIATPGRVIDHMGRKSINLKTVRFWVLDETDRMMDMGFIKDMKRIGEALPEGRQTLMFSATMPKAIMQLANQFQKEPVRIKIGSVTSTIDLVTQEIVCMAVREKLGQLLHELNTRQGSVLVFVKTKHGADRLAKQLKMYGVKVNAIHGDLRQNRRKQVLEDFRDESVRVLVATDVAARGIDVPHIAHVVNYDLPQCPEDYIHRVGRTGRAGAVGCAVSFIAGDEDQWRAISDVTQFAAPVKMLEKTTDLLPTPKFVPEEESSSSRSSGSRSSGRGSSGRPGRRDSGRDGGRSSGEKRSSRPSRYTQRAKEIVSETPSALPQQETARPDKVRTFRKTVASEQVLAEAAQTIKQETSEYARRAQATQARFQRAKARPAVEGGTEKNAPAKGPARRDNPRGKSRDFERGGKSGRSRFGAKDARRGDKRSAGQQPTVERKVGPDGVRVLRVGASKTGLRKQLDETVESVRQKFRKMKQNGFSKFFKKKK